MKRRHRRRPPQQTSGNELFFKPKVQKKLAVGKLGDTYEVEADAMADKVVNKTEGQGAVQKMEGAEEEVQQKPLVESISSVQLDAMKKEEPLIHRMEEEEPVQAMEEEEPVQAMEEEEPVQAMEEEEPVQAMEEEEPVQAMEEEEPVQAMEEEEPVQAMEEEEPVQAMEEEEPVQAMEEEEPVQAMEEEEPVQAMEEEEPVQAMEEEEPVQTKSQGKANPRNSLESNLKKSKGSGGKMSAKTRGEMESGFGTDLGGVRIHTDDAAVQMSKELGAQAFTHGKDIYFNEGKYNPNSKEGKHLLAHELTHTIQQKGNSIRKKDEPAPNVCDRAAISKARQEAFTRVQNVKQKVDMAVVSRSRLAQERIMSLVRKLVSPKIRSLPAVQTQIERMKNALTSDQNIVCGPEIENCEAWNAYVEDNSSPIHLCNSFFDTTRMNEEGQIRTLIHEAAHVAGRGNPAAEQYLMKFDCEDEANDYDSADAWAHFVNCASNQIPDSPKVENYIE